MQFCIEQVSDLSRERDTLSERVSGLNQANLLLQSQVGVTIFHFLLYVMNFV